jgi:hypothetical protein
MMVRPNKPVPPPSAPLNNQQQIPRPAYKQQLPPQHSANTSQSQPQYSQQPQPSPKMTKRERFDDNFFTDENYKEPRDTGSSEDEQELFPVKKKRPRAVVY